MATKQAPYLAIHRVAVSSHHHGRGLAGELFQRLFDQIDHAANIESVRIDTHPRTWPCNTLLKEWFSEQGQLI